MTADRTIGEVAELVRSKNAGPFWQTLDVFFADDEAYREVVDAGVVNPAAIAELYRIPEGDVAIFELPSIRVIKISFPRPTAQGGVSDRDMHAGQQHVPLAQVRL
jgi:hypothetical protein